MRAVSAPSEDTHPSLCLQLAACNACSEIHIYNSREEMSVIILFFFFFPLTDMTTSQDRDIIKNLHEKAGHNLQETALLYFIINVSFVLCMISNKMRLTDHIICCNHKDTKR